MCLTGQVYQYRIRMVLEEVHCNPIFLRCKLLYVCFEDIPLNRTDVDLCLLGFRPGFWLALILIGFLLLWRSTGSVVVLFVTVYKTAELFATIRITRYHNTRSS
jgi:hypothetical protein